MKQALLSVFIILAVLVTDGTPMVFLVHNAEAQVDAFTEDIELLGDILTESLIPYSSQESFDDVSTESLVSSTLVLEPSQEKPSREYVEDEVIVKYKESKIDLNSKQGRVKAESVANILSLDQVERLPLENISILKIQDGETVEETIEQLERNTNVEYAQPNYQYESATNDTHFSKLWALENTGQSVNATAGTSDADSDIPEAWIVNEGTHATNSIIVAVIDIGVAYNHPDLMANMWDGTNCVSDTNAVLGNCIHGYDYEDNDKIPLPIDSSHGTHIAGTIASIKNNTKGIAGTAPNAKIMAIRTSLTTADNIQSINFAKYNGAKVINASWAGASYDQALHDAIDAFPGIFVAAAGNNNRDNESVHMYPSDFDSANIISVAATDQNDNLASFSNFGTTSVDVGAPGTNIYSTIANETVLNESFEGVIAPAVPIGWVQDGVSNNWGSQNLAGDWGNVLYADTANPYANNASTSITSPIYDVSSIGASIEFWAQCDTEYSESEWRDYMTLEMSGDGNTFTMIERWDEAELDDLNNETPMSDTDSAEYHFTDISVPIEYRTANFKFRFRFTSNATDSTYDGCFVDDVLLSKFTDGSDERYGFMQGTSMAAPQVAGLTALLMGYNPALTTAEVKNIILTTGDSKASLLSKTVSGKRINAQSALLTATPLKSITVFNFTSPAVTGVINEGAKTITLEVPYGTSLSALVPTIVVSPGASVSPAPFSAQDFTNPTAYTVTAVDGNTQVYDVTVSVAAGGGGGGGGGGGSSSKNKKTVLKTTSTTTLTTKTPLVSTSSVPVPVIQTVPQRYLFLVDLNIGSNGKDVVELQKRLAEEGVYTSIVSGYYGQRTSNGVKAYQSKIGIPPTGYLGAQTRAKLNEAPPKASVPITANTTREALIISLKAQLAILLKELALLLK